MKVETLKLKTQTQEVQALKKPPLEEPQKHKAHEHKQHESEQHGQHNHGGHGSAAKHNHLNEPYEFKWQALAAFNLGGHYLPKAILCPGWEAAALLGIQQNKRHFMLGPIFQWNKGARESYGLNTKVRNLFAGMQIQFGRSLGKRWTISGGPTVGWRHLKATDLLLEQGIILSESKTQAFEIQGQVKVSAKAFKGLELFTGFRLGHAFYLVDRDILLLGGFNMTASLGVSFGRAK